jgi:TPR repeat protein
MMLTHHASSGRLTQWLHPLVWILLLSTGVACQSGPSLEAKAQRAEAENRHEDALKLYKRACEKDVFTSCLRQGNLLAKGLGAPKNEAEALKAWLRACDAQLPEGCAEAAGVLARTPAGEGRAQELDKKACTLGRKASCIEWSRRVIDALRDKISDAPMEQKDEYGRAFARLREACHAGEQRGCEIVCSRTNGRDEEACSAACDKGVASACHTVARARLRDEKRDLKAIQALETKACEGGEPAACLSLARGAKRGWFKGVQPLAVLAKRACELGDCSAACELGDAPACQSEAQRLASKGDQEASEAYAATACRRGLAAACKSQSPSAPAPEGTEASDEPFELMRAVCGVEPLRRRVEGTEKESITCPSCPLAFTANDARAPSFETVALGSFAKPGRREALVALDGCEGYELSGITNGTFGRRMLLADVDGHWKQIRYYPTNVPSLDKSTLRLRATDGTDVFLSHEVLSCRMGGCAEAWRLVRLTEKNIQQRVILSSDYNDSQWSWSESRLGEDGTIRLMLLPKEEEGEYIVEWKWDGDDLTLQRDNVSSAENESGVTAELPEEGWRAARSFD